MSETPQQRTYTPPPASAGEVDSWTVPLSADDYIFVRQHVYRGKIVDFALMQYHSTADGEHEVARIDCCHGTVHRHVFDQAGNDMVDGKPIQVIPAQGGHDTVTLLFDECTERMMNEYEANLRRWQRT